MVATLDGSPVRATFPLYVDMFGVSAVVIPTTEYERLRAVRDLPGRIGAYLDRPSRQLPSTIERDPEVAAFLRQRFALADTVKMAREACEERYGAARTPSATRIQVFRSRVMSGG